MRRAPALQCSRLVHAREIRSKRSSSHPNFYHFAAGCLAFDSLYLQDLWGHALAAEVAAVLEVLAVQLGLVASGLHLIVLVDFVGLAGCSGQTMTNRRTGQQFVGFVGFVGFAVEVAQTSELDTGTFQLHQGLQRRISIDISHSSGDALPWGDITAVRVGKIQLVDSAGKTPNMTSNEPNVVLKLASSPVFRENANGTRSITVNAQWDSSLHGSLLLAPLAPSSNKSMISSTGEMSSELDSNTHNKILMIES